MEQNLFNVKIVVPGIYKITNNVNNKVYIGQSINCHSRWNMHYYSAFHYNSQQHLYKAMRKYGFNNFSFEVIKETYDLDYWERFFIKMYNSQNPKFGYNYQPGGEGGWNYVNDQIKAGLMNHPMNGHVWTDEQKSNMSRGRKGKFSGDDHYLSKMTPEERKLFICNKNKKFTAPWWNNGTKQVRCFEQPGPEWVKGCLENSSWHNCKGKKWFNNGEKSVRSFECPDGFVPGRLSKPPSV